MSTEKTNNFSTTETIRSRIKSIWSSLADQPGKRAIEAAKLCMAAPDLVDWVCDLILDEIPDSPERTLALNRLAFVVATEPVYDEADRGRWLNRQINPPPDIRPPAPPPERPHRAAAAPANSFWGITTLKRSDEPEPASRPRPVAEAVGNSSEAVYEAIFKVAPTITAYTPDHGLCAPSEAPDHFFRIDPELGRLAVALHYSALFRLWTVGRQMTRQLDGCGWVTKADLVAVLVGQGVKLSARHLRRLFKQGEGIFWNINGDRVYLRGWVYVSRTLTRHAVEQGVGSPETNPPGARQVLLPVAGSLEQFEAMLYVGWLLHRKALSISRDWLEILFGRDRRTLRRWEKQWLGRIVQLIPNFAQCAEWQRFFDHIPDHATTYLGRGENGPETRVRWQMPNTYRVNGVAQHPRRGQARKARKAVRRELNMPADGRRGGSQRFYFETAEGFRKFQKRKKLVGFVGFVWLGESRRGQGIFEITDNGYPLTRTNDRVGRKRATKYRRQRWLKQRGRRFA